MNSLITFIISRVIWERVHDFQLGKESYQIKVNLTVTTLTFPGIKEYEPYSIVDKPTTCLIYLNNKNEKRVMYLVEIMKFCDAILEKVLKEVKLEIFQSEPWKKPPLLGELDRDIMRAFEIEITKHISHREQMRRWESFMNGRPILPTMRCHSGLIRRIKLGSSDIIISHTFYADDVIILTEWNADDLDNINHVLYIFYLASALIINIHKSNIYGIGVLNEEFSVMASSTGYVSGSFPFTYLGLLIGSNMTLISNCKTLIDRFQMRLPLRK
ncbi:hypothetical protein Tco_0545448 [Tanacetum coccineum]